MGAAISSSKVAISASSTSPSIQAVQTAARAINSQSLKLFTLTSQRLFYVNAHELNKLLPEVAKDTVLKAFAVFDPTNKGSVDSCELFAGLVLVAPQLSRDTKQREIFQMFNTSTHRVGLLVVDEATLLFRTVAVGAAKLLRAAIASDVAAEELPRLPFFENLTKALFGEAETLRYEDFARLCQATTEIDALMAQWTLDEQ